MAYEKQVWECGDVVTAEKLNHMEQGIEDASSGGGTSRVEKIKLGDAFSGGLSDVGGGIKSVYAGGSFSDGKTLGELTSGKTILGFVAGYEFPMSNNRTFYEETSLVCARINVGKDGYWSYDEDVVPIQDTEFVQTAGGIAVRGLTTNTSAEAGSYTFTIYAICI